MPGNADNPLSFWQELKRRKVIRVITVYAASAFVILELVSIIEDPLQLPDWTLAFVIVLLCIGFIITVIFSWIYDITPEGIEKTKPAIEVKENIPEKPSVFNVWKVATIVSVVVMIGLVIFNVVSNKARSRDIQKLEKSIAVLPFDNLSTDEEHSHIGDAITDEIIMELQKINEFDRVLSRSSTMQYKDNRPTIPEIAEKLGINFIIEGSIQRHNEEVSIRVQVIRSEPEDHIWGDEYNGKWEDIFSIQNDIAINVTKELQIVLSPIEIEQIEK
jgi:TolB-like protein